MRLRKLSHSIDDDDQRTRQFHSSAPLHQLIKQKLVIFFAGLMFLGGPAISFCILLFLSPLYNCGYQNFLLVPYFVWYAYDSLWKRSQHNGGHRFDFIRSLSIWKAFAAYFPVNLIPTATLNPSKTYLMGIHPHGLFSLGAFAAFAAFATESVDVRSKLPGITPHLGTLALNFLFPFTREYLMSLGLVSVARQSFRSVLKKAGNAMIVVIGGAEEVKDAQPGSMKLFFEGRHGFAKEAIKVYIKSCDPDCKILYILVNLNGIVVVAVGFISGHRALDFKPVSDMKMKICHAENEDEIFSIFQKIEFTL